MTVILNSESWLSLEAVIFEPREHNCHIFSGSFRQGQWNPFHWHTPPCYLTNIPPALYSTLSSDHLLWFCFRMLKQAANFFHVGRWFLGTALHWSNGIAATRVTLGVMCVEHLKECTDEEWSILLQGRLSHNASHVTTETSPENTALILYSFAIAPNESHQMKDGVHRVKALAPNGSLFPWSFYINSGNSIAGVTHPTHTPKTASCVIYNIVQPK
jgi:hypothetical protein